MRYTCNIIGACTCSTCGDQGTIRTRGPRTQCKYLSGNKWLPVSIAAAACLWHILLHIVVSRVQRFERHIKQESDMLRLTDQHVYMSKVYPTEPLRLNRIGVIKWTMCIGCHALADMCGSASALQMPVCTSYIAFPTWRFLFCSCSVKQVHLESSIASSLIKI